MAIETRAALTAEFAGWASAHPALPEGDAMDMIHGEITPEQRTWLSDFIIRWEAMEKRDDRLRDLAGHLAYHSSIGYAECRDLGVPAMISVPAPEVTGRTDGDDLEFTVEHEGESFLVTVERVVKS